jgi:hypothetical protein
VHETLDPNAVARRLEGLDLGADMTGSDLAILSAKGISHDHWRIGTSGLVLRIPRMNQWGMDAEAALAYQEAAFRRAAASGRTPAWRHTLAPDPALPRGALIVAEIRGRAPALPQDLTAIAETLAAIHELPLPDGADMPPLQVHRNPVSSTLLVIEEQAEALAKANMPSDSLAAIEDELEWARSFAGAGEPDFAMSLVGTDTHPGNFLIEAGGTARFVDLEKALYGAAPIDLAHATLTTSTGWDPDCRGAASRNDVVAFYRHYLDRVGTERADALAPWLVPFRRLTWLRTITWFARWHADWSSHAHAAARDAKMSAHIRAHIVNCFAPENIESTRDDWLDPNALAV